MPGLVLKTPQEREQEQRKNIWAAEKEQKKSVLEGEKEIKIKINPRSFIKKIVLVLLLLSVFLAGRWTVDTTTATSSSDFSLSGFVTSFIDSSNDTTTEQKATETEQPAPQVEEKTEEVLETAPEETVSPENSEESSADVTGAATIDVPEPIITTYSSVAVALTNVKVNWMETWGRITDLSYTIKNNEKGTIKPKYVVFTVEGYDDEGQKRIINLPLSQQLVKAGETITGTVTIQNGFAYSAASAGDLTTVRLNIVLFDVYDKSMASFSKEFNLKR